MRFASTLVVLSNLIVKRKRLAAMRAGGHSLLRCRCEVLLIPCVTARSPIISNDVKQTRSCQDQTYGSILSRHQQDGHVRMIKHSVQGSSL